MIITATELTFTSHAHFLRITHSRMNCSGEALTFLTVILFILSVIHLIQPILICKKNHFLAEHSVRIFISCHFVESLICVKINIGCPKSF